MIPTYDLARAIVRARPGARWALAGNDTDLLVWSGPGDAPTLQELDDAAALLAAEDAAAAQTAAAEAVNETTIRTDADQALASLRAYRDLAAPTNAQTVAAVKLLCRVCIALIRLVLRKLDGAS